MNDLILENTEDAVKSQSSGNVAMLEQAKDLVVTCQEEYEAASIIIKAIKEMVSERKEYFEPRKKRAKEVHTDWCNAEKAACKDLEDAESIIKKKMSSWFAAEQQRKEEERRRLEDDAKKNNIDPALIIPVEQKVSGSGQREMWGFKVVDFSKVPDEYKLPNESALSALAKTQKGNASVAGIEFYKYYTTVNR